MAKVNPFSTRTMQPGDWAAVAPEFYAREFNHPDEMGFEFLLWLRDLRRAVGFPLLLSSDHRPPARNETVGGAKLSAHLDTPCDAVDIRQLTAAHRFTLIFEARAMGCRRFGVYGNKSVHIDRAGDPKGQDVIWVTV